MAERSNAAVLKTAGPSGPGGSNPSPSATFPASLPSRAAGLGSLAALYLLDVALVWLVNALGEGFYEPFLRISGGFLRSTLIASLIVLAPVLLFSRLVCGLAPRDFGWRRDRVLPGLGFALLLWLLAQGAALVLLVGQGRGVAFSSVLAERPVSALGELFGQLFGNALVEETLYRGLFLSQFALFFAVRGARRPLLWALVVSSLLFSLHHIPNRLLVKHVVGVALFWDHVRTFLLGLILAGLFVRTRNLFAAVAVHALWNRPTFLCDFPRGDSARLLVLGTLLYLFASIVLAAVRRRRAGSGEERASLR